MNLDTDSQLDQLDKLKEAVSRSSLSFFERVDICQALDNFVMAQKELVRLTDCLTEVQELLDAIENDLGSDYIATFVDRS